MEKRVSPYKNYQDELSSYDGLLLKVNRIIVPESMQSEIKSQIHYGHPGMHESGKYECFLVRHKKRNHSCCLKLQYVS